MIVLCAGSLGLIQMAGSSAASPPWGTGSVSTVAVTVSSDPTIAAKGMGARPLLEIAPDDEPESSDFDFSFFLSLSFFFSDLSLALSSLNFAEADATTSAKPRTATSSVNTKPLIDFNPRLQFIESRSSLYYPAYVNRPRSF